MSQQSTQALSIGETNGQALIEAFTYAAAQITEEKVLPASKRSKTAQNYSSALHAFYEWRATVGASLPTKNVLHQWRDEMLADETGGRKGGPVSISTINTRLSAMRKLILAASDIVLDMDLKALLRDWADIENAKEIHSQDKIEEDYGRRLTKTQIRALFDLIGTGNIRALRDRAIIALGVGAGLRISEITNLTVRDVFHTQSGDQSGIRIRLGKHKKSRIAVVGNSDSWVLQYVREYCDVIGLDYSEPSAARIIRGVRLANGKHYTSIGNSLNVRSAQRALSDYKIKIGSETTAINAHDLRRTYAKLSKDAGMSWEALSAQLGHASVRQTEEYVGRAVKWDDRVLTWEV